MPRLPSMIVISIALLSASLSQGEDDPLDSVDGTEGWDDIDTSAVDEAQAWRQWHIDLRRWEAGKARLESERSRMAHYRQRSGNEQIFDEVVVDHSGQDLQARIDAARRTAKAGGRDERDSEGQTSDDERPWSSR